MKTDDDQGFELEPETAKFIKNLDVIFERKPLWKWYYDKGIIIDFDEIDNEYTVVVTYNEFMKHYRKRND